MTQRLYLSQPDLSHTTAVIQRVGRDDRGLWLGLDRTLFHPQGGGQPSDGGVLRFDGEFGFPLIAATWSPGGSGLIHHYIADASLGDVAEGIELALELDATRRHLHASLHTAGHLLAAVGEALSPGVQAVKGHHFPRACYVEFAGPREDLEQLLARQDEWQHQTQQAIAQKAPVFTNLPTGPQRLVGIGTYPGMGCGGTHVSSLGELAGIQLKSLRLKSSRLRVSYDVIAPKEPRNLSRGVKATA